MVPQLLARARFEAAGTVAMVCGPEVMMRFTVQALLEAGVDADRILVSLERNMQCAIKQCGHCQLGLFRVRRRPGDALRARRALAPAAGGVMATRPRLAVWKFASCDGCQLTLLNCEDELLPVAGAIEIASFPEASRAVIEGP